VLSPFTASADMALGLDDSFAFSCPGASPTGAPEAPVTTAFALGLLFFFFVSFAGTIDSWAFGGASVYLIDAEARSFGPFFFA